MGRSRTFTKRSGAGYRPLRFWHARAVLRDCYELSEQLGSARSDHELRRAWRSFIVTVRSVGHVAVNQDAAKNTRLKALLNTEFLRWKTGEAVFLFIEQERNSLLKEGTGTVRFGAGHDFGKVLAFGQFDHAIQIAKQVLAWWERELERIEDRASSQ